MWQYLHLKTRQLAAMPGIQQSLITIGGSLVASGAAAIALMILIRHLGTVAFGQFSVGFSIMLILVKLNDWGLTTVLQKFGSTKYDKSELNYLFSWVTHLRLISWSVTILVGLVSYQWLAARLRFDQPYIILWAFLLTPLVSWSELALAILQSLHRFTQAAIATGLQGIIKVGVALVMLFTKSIHPGILLLIYGGVPTLVFVWLRPWLPDWFKIKLGVTSHPEALQLTSLARHASVAVIISGLVENVDLLFVQRYLNAHEVGLLAGINMIALLFGVLAYALSTVLNPRVARYDSWIDQKIFLQKAWWLLGGTILGWLALIPFAKVMIWLTIGPAYLEGASYLVILLAASMLSIALVPFSALFYSINKPWIFSLTAIAQLIIILVGNIGFVPEFGLNAAVWTKLIARLVLLALTLVLVLIYFRQPTKTQLKSSPTQ